MNEDENTLFEVVQRNKHYESMIALRNAIAAKMDECRSMRDYAPLALRLQEVLAEIQALEKAETDSKFNDLTKGFSWN